ncbi:hypothetical protein [Streptomyces antibioticus]|uniref:hypothetical protein n=1 Tax=Streptomyces antibioticus TaxID=1890 RepID=UPI003F4D671F
MGTASASGLLIRSVTNKNRSSDRRLVTMLLASAVLRRAAPSMTKRVTCSAVSAASPCSSGAGTVAKKARIGGRQRRIDSFATPRSSRRYFWYSASSTPISLASTGTGASGAAPTARRWPSSGTRARGVLRFP